MSRTESGEYRCNWCKANLTQGETTPAHITLALGPKSGLYTDRSVLPGWRRVKRLPEGVFNFCDNEVCLSNWIMAELHEPVGDAV